MTRTQQKVVGEFWSASSIDLVYFRQAFGPISGRNSMWYVGQTASLNSAAYQFAIWVSFQKQNTDCVRHCAIHPFWHIHNLP